MNRDEAYSFLDRVAKGLAETFGKQCETLIHDMNVKGNPILSIYNNEVTGRDVGSIVDVLGSTKDMNEVLKEVDFINHLAITPDGRQIKSSTFHMIGEDYKFALGINFDFSELVQANRLLLNLMNVGGDLQSAISQAGEGMVSTLFDECLVVIGKLVEDMNKRDRMKLIKLLKQKNVFDMHKSVPYVSEKLKVSRYTIYNYLNEIEEE